MAGKNAMEKTKTKVKKEAKMEKQIKVRKPYPKRGIKDDGSRSLVFKAKAGTTKRAKQGTRVLQKIRFYSAAGSKNFGKLWITRIPFQRLVKCACANLQDKEILFAKGARDILQLVVERESEKVMRQANTACTHAKRLTVREEDINAARSIINDGRVNLIQEVKPTATSKKLENSKSTFKQLVDASTVVAKAGNEEEDFFSIYCPKNTEIEILARKAGVVRIGGSVFNVVRAYIKDLVQNLVLKAIIFRDGEGKKTVSHKHVHSAAAACGMPVLS